MNRLSAGSTAPSADIRIIVMSEEHFMHDCQLWCTVWCRASAAYQQSLVLGRQTVSDAAELSCSLHEQAADEKLARAQSRLTERERQSLQAQAAVSAAWARAEA